MEQVRTATWLVLIGSFTVGATSAPPAAGNERAVSFRAEVRPILAASCFKCHGPDPATREADLRLDDSEAAKDDRGGYAAIVPGNAEASTLYRRITSTDESERMPPPEAKRQLSRAERELLRRWIEEGARYEPHWSFIRPTRPDPPPLSKTEWALNDIDRHVLAELDRRGLIPSPPADRYQLIRRLHLDLIGLPPTPDEADEFVEDSRPDAYERIVDKLLSSPHYGERWARRWLDLARYSDTNGYEKDRPRTMWPYRDWVINAINADMPFDQFTIEQLAGDMLPNATREQRIATGFHRNTMVNEEGGIDPQEFRFNAVVDRVGVTGAVWLGLTLGCAQCHTHKYDPITHEEFYRIFAIFNNADEVDERIVTPEIAERRAELQAQIDSLIETLPQRYMDAVASSPEAAQASGQDRLAALQSGFEHWQNHTAAELTHWRAAAPVAMKSNLADMEVLQDDSVLVSGDVTKNDVYELQFDLGQQPVTAIRLEALTHASLPANGPGRQSIEVPNASAEGDFFLSEMTAEVVQGSGNSERVIRRVDFAAATATFVTPGLSAESAFDGRADTGWRVMGRQGEPHAAVFSLRTPVTLQPGQRLRLRLQHESFYPAGLGRFRCSFASESGEHPLTLIPDAIVVLLRAPEARRTAEQHRELLTYFLLNTVELKESREKIAELRKQAPKPVLALVMQERSNYPRTSRRHHRGEFLKPEEVVAAGVPDILPPLPADLPANRLTFARWLVNGENPLTARVFVNRQWQAFFSRGLVTTLEDFGLQGEYPSHPALLDFLATEFVRNGWSMKKLHKMIVMSAVYRQSAEVTPKLLAEDPENRALARAPRFRVEAELVRDVTLAASGLLCRRIGGPSVFPDQPAGITEAAYGPLDWKVSSGEDRFRRGLYTFNKRTAPFAAFGLFDAPSGEACAPRRTYSNTPLQALAMLNETATVAAARTLAMTATANSRDSRSIATEMFRRCVTRPPDEAEIEALCEFQAQAQRRFASGEADPVEVLHGGDEGFNAPHDDANNLAAWMLTARALLNLDETLTRQ